MTYDWDSLKPDIHDLYLSQRLTLDQVRREICSLHGVTIKNRTFREKLKEWKFRRSDHKDRHRINKSRLRRRSFSRMRDSSNSPTRNSVVSHGTASEHTPSPASPGAIVLLRGRPAWSAGAEDFNHPLSSNPQLAIYEDPQSTHQDLEQNFQIPREGMRMDAGFPDRGESTENSLAPMATRLPLGQRYLTELRPAQMNARGNIAEPQLLQNACNEPVLRVQPGHFFTGGRRIIQTLQHSAALGSMGWKMCRTCYHRNNTPWAQGDFVPCHENGCLYFELPDMRAPSLPAPWTQIPTAESYPRAMLGSNIREPEEGNLYASTAQITTSGHYSSCPSLINHCMEEEMQPTESVSGPAAEQVFHYSIQGPQLYFEGASKTGYNGRTENIGPLSHHLQSQNIGPSPQDYPPHYTDTSSLSLIGSQMNDFPYTTENYDSFLEHIHFQHIGNHQLPQPDKSAWHGGYLDLAQVVNTSTPPVGPFTLLTQGTPYAQAMGTAMPQARPHAIPQNDLEAQNTTIAMPQEGFGMIAQQNNFIESDETYMAPWDHG